MQNDSNLIFEQEYIKNAPEWAIEKEKDGTYKYHATIAAYKLYEALQSKIDHFEELLKNQNLENFKLENDCMIGQTWFMKGTPVSNLIKHAEKVYKSEAISQNSKIEFGTDDHQHWFAHDVPFFGRVQIDKIEEHGLEEWDIYFGDCWQGPFSSKAQCIEHLEICIEEKCQENMNDMNDNELPFI